MSIYETISDYAVAALFTVLPLSIAAAQGDPRMIDDPQIIDGYSVTAQRITKREFPGSTSWEDTDGDGEFDTKIHTSVSRRCACSKEQPFEESDRELTANLVARLDN